MFSSKYDKILCKLDTPDTKVFNIYLSFHSFIPVAPVTDTVNPVIIGCPMDIAQTVPAAGQTTAVTWIPPTATDNVTPDNQIIMTQTHSSGSQFGVGTTPVTYLAIDAAGNQAVCTFNVVITGKSNGFYVNLC